MESLTAIKGALQLAVTFGVEYTLRNSECQEVLCALENRDYRISQLEAEIAKQKAASQRITDALPPDDSLIASISALKAENAELRAVQMLRKIQAYPIDGPLSAAACQQMIFNFLVSNGYALPPEGDA